MAAKKARLQYWREGQEWRFRLRGRNGKAQFISEIYRNETQVLVAIAELRDNMASAVIEQIDEPKPEETKNEPPAA